METTPLINSLDINYSTLTVCRRGEPRPFSRWTQSHVNQGFIWRPESVSFVTLDSEASCPHIKISLMLMGSYTAAEGAVRIIRLPFQSLTGGIEVTSPLSESWLVDLPADDYSLFFAIEVDPEGSVAEPWLYQLTFVKTLHGEPAQIVRADKDLIVPNQLDMSAEPA